VATTEFRRFSIEDLNAGLTIGWTFAVGWFAFQTSWWAWFVRSVPEE
jgi:hypothetical protein